MSELTDWQSLQEKSNTIEQLRADVKRLQEASDFDFAEYKRLRDALLLENERLRDALKACTESMDRWIKSVVANDHTVRVAPGHAYKAMIEGQNVVLGAKLE